MKTKNIKLGYMERLQSEAAKHGLTIVEKGSMGSGHIQVSGGPLLVNYYPNSPKRTAYVAGMNGSFKHVEPEEAVRMALKRPEPTGKKDKRSTNGKYRKWKLQILKNQPYCRWCKKPLTIENATLEHIVPLAIGGLDNRNNATVACEPCNKARGHEMIELGEVL